MANKKPKTLKKHALPPDPLAEAKGSLIQVVCSKGQHEYWTAISDNTMVLCHGMAGTGKTFIAVAKALHLLFNHHVKRIVICRPIVEAGEKMGYLPGPMEEKIHPFLRPIFDSLARLLKMDDTTALRKAANIEICPLAHMRGRTFDDTVMILDEAQNATYDQLFMFITRLGMRSKLILCGDTMQSDIGRFSGLNECIKRLEGVRQLAVIKLTKVDLHRNPMLTEVIDRLQAPLE